MLWQPSGRDFVQLSGNYSGPQLIAQDYRKPSEIVNVGYRRKIDDRFSLTFTWQNILDTAQQETVIDTPQLLDRLRQKGPGPILLFGLTWNLGAQTERKLPEPRFGFDQS